MNCKCKETLELEGMHYASCMNAFIKRPSEIVLARKKVAYFHFVAWDCISFGLHVSLTCPNVEIHVPFGFFRIGWVKYMQYSGDDRKRTFGFESEWKETVIDHK